MREDLGFRVQGPRDRKGYIETIYGLISVE